MATEKRPAAEPSLFTLTTRAVVNVGTVATVLVATVTDVLAPIGPRAFWFAFLPLLAIGVFFWSPKRAPRIHEFGQRCFPHYWQKPFLGALAVCSLLLFAASFVTDSAPAGGFVAAQVPQIRDLQEQLGVIDSRTRAIEETTRSIKNDTEEIKKKLDKVKQETSSDPRKELANLGVVWSTESFVDALKNGDERVTRLFLSGDMSPAAIHNGASALIFIMQPKLQSPVPMLRLIIESGFDLNTNLVDDLIMRDYGASGFSSMPPQFENPDLPGGYIGGGSFRGPVLLWLAIRSSYGITEEWDVATIEFLRSAGAETKLTRAFLDAMKSAWGDTTPYQTVRAAVS